MNFISKSLLKEYDDLTNRVEYLHSVIEMSHDSILQQIIEDVKSYTTRRVTAYCRNGHITIRVALRIIGVYAIPTNQEEYDLMMEDVKKRIRNV